MSPTVAGIVMSVAGVAAAVAALRLAWAATQPETWPSWRPKPWRQ